MGSSFGGTVKLTGESEYKRALKDITSNLKVLNSEMKTITSQYDKNDKSAKKLTGQNEVLTKKITEQKEKVRILSEALEKSKKETGENSDSTKKWQVQLNNAQADLNKMEREVKNNTEALKKEDDTMDKTEKGMKDYGEATEDAGKKTSRFADILKANLASEAILAGTRALGRALREIGSGLVTMGKQALEAYAKYEQLVGGVDTLFKESSEQVQKYAQNAYKTAGMSANTYMETVTAFSASLLQSLNGDTAKSAKIADMAITDMADNANKMGTSMESIQYAYQGFAKQNYTMLDNLKLGYGGTKSEMERLLADAEKLSGVKYDINNLNDVFNAIHVIQQEMGITGTTAKEAQETIEGSILMAKASWENLLTGLADDNADFDSLVNNFVDSVVIAGENLLPRIKTMLEGMVQLVLSISDKLIEYLPKMMETGTSLLQSLFDGVVAMIPKLGEVARSIVMSLSQYLHANLPSMLQAGITALIEFINGIAQCLPELIPIAIECVLDLAETILDNVEMIIDTGIKVLIALVEGIVKSIPILVEKAPVIIAKLATAIIKLQPKILAVGVQLIGELAKGVVKAIPTLVGKIPSLISKMVAALKKAIPSVRTVGKNIVNGIWSGISAMASWLKNKVASFASGIVSTVKKKLKINSPSKVFADEVGSGIAEGIGYGFEENIGDVADMIADGIPTEFDTSITNIGDASSGFSYDSMVSAFRQALEEMKVELDDKEVGKFVIKTVEREVFA